MIPIDPRTVWDEAEPLLLEALFGFDDSPNEIMLDCLQRQAFFYASKRAFVVFQPVLGDVLIRVAVSRGPTDCIIAELPEVQAIAKGMGGKRVMYRTNRRGFERKMPENWKIHHVAWAAEL